MARETRGAKRPLTQAQILRLTKEGNYADGTVRGLSFVVHAGARVWVYRRQAIGKRYQVTLGSAVAPIAEIRKKANAFAAMSAAEFSAHMSAPKKEIEEAKGTPTFKEAMESFCKWQFATGIWREDQKIAQVYVSQLKRIALPILGNMQLDKIVPADVARVITDGNFGHYVRLRVLRLVSLVFKWSIAQGLLQGDNPAEKNGPLQFLIPKLSAKPASNRGALKVEEIPKFMAELYKKRDSSSGRCFLFSILTATRSGSVRNCRWEQINFKENLWTIPESNLKVKTMGGLQVPLSSQAIKILMLCGPRKEGLVFPSSMGGGVLSDMTFCAVLRRLDSKWTDREQSASLGRQILVTQHGIARATFRTWAQDDKLGNDRLFDPIVAELCLHHTIDRKYNGAYQRNKMMDRRREMLSAWGDYCFSDIDVKPE